ncbi:MAG: 30S ribosomal protein S6 [Candidatus Sungbacteria bacterium]|nr:30S ribosomal protein S6 [Candidatus Sungbacteria bacterium]
MDLDVRKYEIAYLVSPRVAEDDVVRIAGIVTGAIEEQKGVVRHVEEPKKRKLAYPVENDRMGYLGYTRFSADPNAASGISKKLKFQKEIMRFLVVEEEIEPEKRQITRRAWRSTEGLPSTVTVGAPKRETEIVASPEEREANIEKIDKRLEEILGQ